jgi:uncharacterized membrane protein
MSTSVKLKTAARILFGLFFIAAGINHFVMPQLYMRIEPPLIPFPDAVVIVSGIAEIALGAGLIVPQTSRWSAWGLVALLIAVYPANIFMAVRYDQFLDVAPSIVFHIIRLPLQFVMIGLALWFTRS